MIKRGDIFYADLGFHSGSIQNGVRPVLVIQNNIGNLYSPTTLVIPFTSQINKRKLPTHVFFKANTCGFTKDSIALCEQIITINKESLKQKIGCCDEYFMDQINEAMFVSFGITKKYQYA